MEYRLLIDGNLVSGASAIDVIYPATGQQFASAPRASAEQAEQAIASAKRAVPAWAALGHDLVAGYGGPAWVRLVGLRLAQMRA